jgi:peroxiredoxin
MEAYRDQYATLFNNGRNVVVLAVSADPDTLLASWARASDFPFVFASDADGTVGRLYDAYSAANRVNERAVYVIAPDGKIAYSVKPFRVLAPAAYAELAAVVDRLSPPANPDSAEAPGGS